MANLSGDLRVNGHVSIPRDELELRVSRSGGPGGQHVNTSSTRVEVRWVLDSSRALKDEEKTRVREKLGARIDADGALRVTSSDSRSQRRNREVAESKLADIVRRALVVPKKRRATKRPRGAEERRLEHKKLRSAQKKNRRWNDER